MSTDINEPLIKAKAVHGGNVSISGEVTKGTQGFSVTRGATGAAGFELSWDAPIEGAYVVDADLNIEGLYRVPTASKTQTSCTIIISNHAGTELFNNFSVAVREI